MDKSELEKLRTLNATEAMIKALKLPGKELDYRGNKRKYRYKVAARCQQLNGILKVSICTREDIEKGITTPKWDIYLNYEGDTYITRERQEDGDYKWRTAMIYNLDGSNWYYSDHDIYMYINPGGNRTIKTLLDTKDTESKGIMEWQQGCRKRTEDKRIKKLTDQWDKEMEPVKDPPKGFEDWYKHKGFDGSNYIYYKGAGAKEGYCTSCLDTVKLDVNPRHNMQARCPVCHRIITYVSRAKKKNDVWTNWRWVSCIQRYKDGLVQRDFAIRRVDEAEWKGTNKCRFIVDEMVRTTIQDNGAKVYVYDDYKRRGKRWHLCENQNIDRNSDKIYPKNLNRIFAKYHSAYPIAAKNGYGASVRYFLAEEKKNPLIEMCIKAGLVELGKDILYKEWIFRKAEIDRKAHELGKMLGIDKARLARLKKMNGRTIHLLWLQEEKKKNTVYRDEDIATLAEADIEPYDMQRHKAFQNLSIRKICNYLHRQSEYRKNVGRNGMTSLRYVWSDWCDYVNMMEKLKMDCTMELLLKPKDLTIAHNELVTKMSLKNSEKEIKKIEKKFQNAQKLMESGELSKYEFCGEKYRIMAPTGIKDIYEEGITLKHCIHTCDIYFQRMDIRETYLLFLRKNEAPDTPWYTLEIEPGGNIRQKKSVLNEAYKDLDDAIPFLKKWQQWVKKNLSEEDKKLAEKSDKARKTGYEKLREDKKLIWHGKLQGTLLVDALEADFMEAI